MISKDQMGREINITKPIERIVSLVPSQTELLVDLGLLDKIVGVTKFCVHPENIRKQKVIVGGTKKINYEKIKELHPDIILCNKEENTKEIVERLEKEYKVHVSSICSISETFVMIEQYGDLFKKKKEAVLLISKIKLEKEKFASFIKDIPLKKVAYFIWKNPWMVAGKGTFINYMLETAGFINVFGDKDRYPEILLKELNVFKDLDLIMLSSEPFPFTNKHIVELNNNTKTLLVDGEYFSWYGSRLVDAFSYFKTLHESCELKEE
ncbi:ABC transporter substrate-binding protein [Aquimarina muelleri]|uniref:Iron ABC transporter n=1 Tax=Aquimarina muelleri TaxID=279356 RepID=A0A918JTI7_9FLAO|nr:helical backbone metal receptor [Aquimarina muelleri]MCX2764802.1 helical backbone metal receptor [Aquimarina muelleri]GGX08577.1 iron ABC transporter [Aquimarina muelleri]